MIILKNPGLEELKTKVQELTTALSCARLTFAAIACDTDEPCVIGAAEAAVENIDAILGDLDYD